MTEKTRKQKVKNRGFSPCENESLIREKVKKCGSDMLGKMDACMDKARKRGREKLFSEAVTLRGKINKIVNVTSLGGADAGFKIGTLDNGDRKAIGDIDKKLISVLGKCKMLLRSFVCAESSMDVVSRYAALSTHLEELRRLFHERKKVLKKLRVYG